MHRPATPFVITTIFVLALATAPLEAQINAQVAVCGTVDTYVSSTALTSGLLVLSGRPYVIAAGVTLTNADLITAGADLCLAASLNATAQITAPATVVANVRSTAELCGQVDAYAAATAGANGSITIAGRRIPIAAGATIANSDQIQLGVNLCLHATLNALGQIVVPSSVSAAAGARVTICGNVDAYSAATSSSNGSITIGGTTYAIAAGTEIENNAAITIGVHICLDATVTVDRRIIPPTRANRSPSLSVPGPQTAAPGHPLTFTVSAADPDAGDVVRISTSGVPPNAGFTPHDGNPATGEFTFTPDASQDHQTFVVTFIADDGHGNTPSDSVTVRVQSDGGGPDQEPDLTVPASPIVIEAGDILEFTVTGRTRKAGCAVALSARDVPPNATFRADSGESAIGEFRFASAASQAGHQFVVMFTVNDCEHRAVHKPVTIMVVAPGTRQPRGDGRLCVGVTEIVFAPAGGTKSCSLAKVTLTNSGAGDLRIESIAIDNPDFRLAAEFANAIVLTPGTSVDVAVGFAPQAGSAPASGTMSITSDDASSRIIQVRLHPHGFGRSRAMRR